VAHPTVRSLEYWLYQYRRTWRGGLATSFIAPILYLSAMGVGIGSLVNGGSARAGQLDGVSYLVFIAPGLLAANAMQTGVQEATYPVMGSFKWVRTYFAMLATPLRAVDVLIGHLIFMALRVFAVVTIFFGVMAAFGAIHAWTAVFVLPAGLLTGIAFSAPVAAFAATRENDSGFSALFRFGIMPMFLFSGTFYPVTQLPDFLRVVAYLTPLWHGVDLCRSLDLGTAELWPVVGHVAYLTAMAVLGGVVALRNYTRRLEV